MNRRRSIRLAPPILLVALVLGAAAAQSRPEAARRPPARWLKGNTHTHTLWSDGDAAPELVADWYRSHGYDFLVLSDHNVLSEGEKWLDVAEGPKSRLTPERVDDLRRRFGETWVSERTVDGTRQMRLKTLKELRGRFEEPGRFIFIQGEEITDSFEGRPVHLNGLNLDELVPPQGGESVRDTIQRNIDAVIDQGRRLSSPVLVHVNHPNFGWALTAADIASIRGENFFEVYNGHPSVRNHGDENHPSTDRLWDIALTHRLTETDLGLLYGLATDDAHNQYAFAVGRANPGRGWIMVRSGRLDADSIIAAMKKGDFYASTGVLIDNFSRAGGKYTVRIRPREGVAFITQFIGTRRAAVDESAVGQVLLETTENPAVYELKGDELYVRAKVISSRYHPNPFAEGDHECAWLQPVVPGR
jgi:hypothetical protein